jgi:REP element-mobilizing transposase RayT
MPRTPRVELEGGIHHVTFRGNRREPIFLDHRDRSFFLVQLDLSAHRHNWRWLAYCLMDNHGHLVIETPEQTLGRGMQRLNGNYAQWFNRRHRKTGHVFQGRFGSKLVDSDAQLIQLLQYVALNPVKAGICEDPTAYRWSSHGRMLAGTPEVAGAHDRVEELLEVWGGSAGGRYAKLFDDTEPAVAVMPPAWIGRPPLIELLQADSDGRGIRAAREQGYHLSEIGAALGVDPSTVSRRLKRLGGESNP